MTDRVIEDIKSRIDLADLIASYGVQVRRVGASLTACCPFHNEKTPSFHINVQKGFYHCVGCGESGDAIKFVQKQEGLTFPEALRKLAEQCGVKLDEKPDPEAATRKRLFALMAELASFYHRCLLKMREAEIARQYLVRRDLGPEVQESYLIGYAPVGAATIFTWGRKYGYTPEELEAAGVVKAPDRPGDGGYHRFGGRLMFTVRDKQGRVVAFSGRQLVENKRSGKYVNSPETPIFRKSSVLFGFDRAAAAIGKTAHREVIVCEGQIDCIRLQTSGFANAVAGQGTAFTDEHVRMLKRVADAAVLVYDDDAAGHKATIRSAGMLLAAEIPVRVVSLPDGDDPDSFLRTKGAEEFQKLLDAAESIVSFQCRVERAKERDPKSIDAVARVSKAVLATISACPGAILKATMVDEAARLLDLPAAALREELEKTRTSVVAPRRAPSPVVAPSPEEAFDEADGDDGETWTDEASAGCGSGSSASVEPDLAGEDAARVEPPPSVELAFLAFLMANVEGADAAKLDGMVGDLLPREVFASEFSWSFVEAWRLAVTGGAEALPRFAEGLTQIERGWFDAVLLNAEKSDASTLRPTAILETFVRGLWEKHLTRRRGALPATGDAEAAVQRLKLTTYLKRLNMVKWSTVREIVRELRAS